MTKFIWINGQFVSADKACISPLDRGFLYGDGIFETMRIYDGVPFRWDWHIERMTTSVQALEIKWKGNTQALKGVVSELAQKNKLKNAYLRITVSRGIHNGDLGFDSDQEPTTVIFVDMLQAPSDGDYEKGIAATVVPHPWASPMAAHKSISYLPYLAAKNKARKKGVREAILCDYAGRFTEGATSNVFIVLDNRVFTPPTDGSILSGIARRVVIESLRNVGVRCEEEYMLMEDAIRADEIFITNSIIEALPITKLDGTAIGGGDVGSITRMALYAYRSEVQKEIEAAKK